MLKKPRVRYAVVAQFFYCGAQVGIWSLLVDFAKEAANVPARTGATVFLFFHHGGLLRRAASSVPGCSATSIPRACW